MAKILGLDESKLDKKEEGKVKEVTLDNITKEDIIVMAKTIQQYEELIKAQKGYIIQLQTQLSQRSQQLARAHIDRNDVSRFVEIQSDLEL